MRSEMVRYIVGFLLAVGLIVVVIVLIVRALISGPSTSPLQPAQHDLRSYENTATTVQLTIDSPVTAPERHHDIIINVGNDLTVLTVTQGYQGQAIRSRTYPMDESAYGVFLRALNANGFTQGNNDPTKKDERGHCALGDRFLYQIIDPSGQEIQHYWYTSCGSGTFNGAPATIRRLFQAQVPDYFQQTNGIAL